MENQLNKPLNSEIAQAVPCVSETLSGQMLESIDSTVSKIQPALEALNNRFKPPPTFEEEERILSDAKIQFGSKRDPFWDVASEILMTDCTCAWSKVGLRRCNDFSTEEVVQILQQFKFLQSNAARRAYVVHYVNYFCTNATDAGKKTVYVLLKKEVCLKRFQKLIQMSDSMFNHAMKGSTRESRKNLNKFKNTSNPISFALAAEATRTPEQNSMVQEMKDDRQTQKQDVCYRFFRIQISSYENEEDPSSKTKIFLPIWIGDEQDLYNLYRAFIVQMRKGTLVCSLKYFKKVWRISFPRLCIQKFNFMSCNTCATLKAEIAEAEKESKDTTKLTQQLNEHMELAKAGRRMLKEECDCAVDNYDCLIIDGSASLALPFFKDAPESVSMARKLKVWLYGFQIWRYPETCNFIFTEELSDMKRFFLFPLLQNFGN